MGFQCGGDLEGFSLAWGICFQPMSKPPDQDMLRALLEVQLRKSTPIKPHFATIDGSRPGSHMRSYDYVYESAHQEIDRTRSEITRHKPTNPQPAPPGAAAAKIKTKGTAKSKGAARSKEPPVPPPATLISKEACQRFL